MSSEAWSETRRDHRASENRLDGLKRHRPQVALGVWIACLTMWVAALTMNILIIAGRAPGGRLDAIDLYYEPGFLALSTFGALIVRRWPAHVMGWLFCAAGFNALAGSMCLTYEQFAGSRELPLLVVALCVAQFMSLTHLLIMLAIVPYLFPDGRLLSRRWRPLLALSIAIIIFATIGDTFGVEVLGEDSRQTNLNPFYIGALRALIGHLDPVFWVAIVPVALLGGVLSLILRYRRARGIERLQIRWLMWGLGLIVSLVLLLQLGSVVPSHPINFDDDHWTVLEITMGMTTLISISIGLPVVLGLVILRYRLYSIDRIINRTLVYGALSLGLAAIYGGSVVLLQGAVAPIARGSDLAVAGSTLVVAALVLPLRRRIQWLVDRHFYRQKYDAARTVEAFSSDIRDAVDLDTLLIDLHLVVQETMQPASVGIWLRYPRQQG